MASKVINIRWFSTPKYIYEWVFYLVNWLRNDAVSRSSTFGSELRGRVVKR